MIIFYRRLDHLLFVIGFSSRIQEYVFNSVVNGLSEESGEQIVDRIGFCDVCVFFDFLLPMSVWAISDVEPNVVLTEEEVEERERREGT